MVGGPDADAAERGVVMWKFLKDVNEKGGDALTKVIVWLTVLGILFVVGGSCLMGIVMYSVAPKRRHW
jgi:hypothetical protein